MIDPGIEPGTFSVELIQLIQLCERDVITTTPADLCLLVGDPKFGAIVYPGQGHPHF